MKGIKVTIGHCTWVVDTSEESDLAAAMWAIARQSGIDIDDFKRFFIVTLRMLNSDSEWAKTGLKTEAKC